MMRNKIAKKLRAWAQRLSPLPMANTIEPAPPCYFIHTLMDGVKTLELKKLRYVHDLDESELELYRADWREGLVKHIGDKLKREALDKLDIPYFVEEGPRGGKRINFYLVYYADNSKI